VIAGARVHYVDEGSGPTLLLLHGNPTWSFLYREIIKELRGEFRCVAVDYPGFGSSVAPTGYGFTPAEHADVVADFLTQLDLSAVTLMVQDWGGPIGFAVATRHPDRFARFVIGNTWARPKSDRARGRSHACSVVRPAAISSSATTSSSGGCCLSASDARTCPMR
jgi:haloalkane dehalogenase